MKLSGGYNVLLEGRPYREIRVLPDPEKLYIPLVSQNIAFGNVCVTDGQQVERGDVLARDEDNYSIPLIAPRNGKVLLNEVAGHIVMEGLSNPDHPSGPRLQEHIDGAVGSKKVKIQGLIAKGAWEFFQDAHTLKIADPEKKPQAVIVSTLSLEPFTARGDAQLFGDVQSFTRGLEQLQSLLEYEPIYLILPESKSDFALQIHEQIRGYAWARLVDIPMKYPYDNPNILARCLNHKKDDGPVWSLKTEGVLAVDNALTHDETCTSRVVSVGGPGAKHRYHIKVPLGYPIEKVKNNCCGEGNIRLINGGILTGRTYDETCIGVDSQCRAITMLPELEEREFLGFAKPGFTRHSYSTCFVSSLRGKFKERMTTAVRGEDRPCISCNFCENVCPAKIMPHLIHKYLYSELLEEADQARVDLCVQCGLCSFVCPSKLGLTEEFSRAMIEIEKDKEEARQLALEEEARLAALEAERASKTPDKDYRSTSSETVAETD